VKSESSSSPSIRFLKLLIHRLTVCCVSRNPFLMLSRISGRSSVKHQPAGSSIHNGSKSQHTIYEASPVDVVGIWVCSRAAHSRTSKILVVPVPRTGGFMSGGGATVVFVELSRIQFVGLELAELCRSGRPSWPGRLRGRLWFLLGIGVRHAQQSVKCRFHRPTTGCQHGLDDGCIDGRKCLFQRIFCLLSRAERPWRLRWRRVLLWRRLWAGF